MIFTNHFFLHMDSKCVVCHWSRRQQGDLGTAQPAYPHPRCTANWNNYMKARDNWRVFVSPHNKNNKQHLIEHRYPPQEGAHGAQSLNIRLRRTSICKITCFLYLKKKKNQWELSIFVCRQKYKYKQNNSVLTLLKHEATLFEIITN